MAIFNSNVVYQRVREMMFESCGAVIVAWGNPWSCLAIKADPPGSRKHRDFFSFQRALWISTSNETHYTTKQALRYMFFFLLLPLPLSLPLSLPLLTLTLTVVIRLKTSWAMFNWGTLCHHPHAKHLPRHLARRYFRVASSKPLAAFSDWRDKRRNKRRDKRRGDVEGWSMTMRHMPTMVLVYIYHIHLQQ